MGTSSPIEEFDVFWIDKNVKNEENTKYIAYLKKNNFAISTYEDLEKGLNEILNNKKNNFKDINIILTGSFYKDFVLTFKKQLKDICIVPKIVIFTKDKESFLEKNSNIKDIIENKFYNLGGIQTLFKGVYDDFLIKKLWKKNYNIEDKSLNSTTEGDQYTFEQINNKLELYLPVFYKALIKINGKDIFDELTHYLYEKYKENEFVKKLLEPIDGIPNVPIQILCKYYARLYTIESDFYDDLNKSLRLENLKLKVEELLFFANKNNYYSITFIKSFYEGIKLECFKYDLPEKLYRFSCIGQKELDEIKECLKTKKQGFPAINFFSKTFLSFSEDKGVANYFYGKYKAKIAEYDNKELVPAFFHIIKKGKINKSFYSHIKIDNISVYKKEKEVLFLPFTSFEILSVTPYSNVKKSLIANTKKIDYYIIVLTYLGQYENDLKNIEKVGTIPETKFKKSIVESRLIELNRDITNKYLIDEFNKYENTLRKNNEEIYIEYDVKKEDIDENNYVSIFGKYIKDYETDFVKENKNKIKVIINNEEKPLDYKYKLNLGYNKIIIKLNSYIDCLEYIFYGCNSLKSIEGLKYLETKYIKDFSNMFYGCRTLSDIKALENWNVSNGNNFDGMFAECILLKNIKALEKWNVSNGKNFLGMFFGCKSLEDIKPLEKWNVSNGNNFEGFFKECESLSDINPLVKWDVSKGHNFSSMFYKCRSLKDIKPLKKWNVSNGNNFEGMFGKCKSLSDIAALGNWNVSKGNNFSGMFYNCSSLSNLKGLQNWNVSKGSNFLFMFRECESLSDISALQKWNVSNGDNFSCMFSFCKKLLNVNALENWDVSNGINFSNMFLGCEALLDIKGLKNWNVSNGNNFEAMFKGCHLSDITALKNWNISKRNNFSVMFS